MRRIFFIATFAVWTCVLAQAKIEPHEFNVRWWNQSTTEEHLQFIAGYVDCYNHDLKDERPLDEMPYAYERRISTWLAKHATAEKELVSTLLLALRSPQPVIPSLNTEQTAGPHGYFTGEYLRDAGGFKQRLAFVSGYLTCYKERLEGKRAQRFSASAEFYEQKLEAYFGIHEQADDLNPFRASVPIATALYRFADR